jgi:hypothetical protein
MAFVPQFTKQFGDRFGEIQRSTLWVQVSLILESSSIYVLVAWFEHRCQTNSEVGSKGSSKQRECWRTGNQTVLLLSDWNCKSSKIVLCLDLKLD